MLESSGVTTRNMETSAAFLLLLMLILLLMLMDVVFSLTAVNSCCVSSNALSSRPVTINVIFDSANDFTVISIQKSGVTLEGL
jgi:hypothetical protein